jgi:hypothetical protein
MHNGEVSEVMEAVTGEVTKVRVWVFELALIVTLRVLRRR